MRETGRFSAGAHQGAQTAAQGPLPDIRWRRRPLCVFLRAGTALAAQRGRLSFVTTNKWFKTGYAEKLRHKLEQDAWVESVVDFGHAKRFFPDADVMPCVLVARRPDPSARPPSETAVAVIPRDAVDMSRLPEQIRTATFSVPRTNLSREGWLLEPPEVAELMHKIRRAGTPLKDYAGVSPMYGVKTGFNEAFVVDTATRERLIREDPRSEEIAKPYLRGEDIDRWASDWAGKWMIFARHGIDITSYPAVRAHLMEFRKELEPRPTDWEPTPAEPKWRGRKPGAYRWYEIQDNVAYWRSFLRSKIFYNDIAWNPQFSIVYSGALINNTAYFIPSEDAWLLASLNAPIGWWFAWREAQHAKDEALRYFNTFMDTYPIPRLPDSDAIQDTVRELAQIQEQVHRSRVLLTDWYRHAFEISSIPNSLRSPFMLAADQFIAAIQKARGVRKPLTASAISQIREEHARTVVPVARRLGEAMRYEQRLSDLVNEAYGLTPAEVSLMWRTAPPRMPIPPPRL